MVPNTENSLQQESKKLTKAINACLHYQDKLADKDTDESKAANLLFEDIHHTQMFLETSSIVLRIGLMIDYCLELLPFADLNNFFGYILNMGLATVSITNCKLEYENLAHRKNNEGQVFSKIISEATFASLILSTSLAALSIDIIYMMGKDVPVIMFMMATILIIGYLWLDALKTFYQLYHALREKYDGNFLLENRIATLENLSQKIAAADELDDPAAALTNQQKKSVMSLKAEALDTYLVLKKNSDGSDKKLNSLEKRLKNSSWMTAIDRVEMILIKISDTNANISREKFIEDVINIRKNTGYNDDDKKRALDELIAHTKLFTEDDKNTLKEKFCNIEIEALNKLKSTKEREALTKIRSEALNNKIDTKIENSLLSGLFAVGATLKLAAMAFPPLGLVGFVLSTITGAVKFNQVFTDIQNTQQAELAYKSHWIKNNEKYYQTVRVPDNVKTLVSYENLSPEQKLSLKILIKDKKYDINTFEKYWQGKEAHTPDKKENSQDKKNHTSNKEKRIPEVLDQFLSKKINDSLLEASLQERHLTLADKQYLSEKTQKYLIKKQCYQFSFNTVRCGFLLWIFQKGNKQTLQRH